MKHFTFFTAFIAFASHAQTFPDPYCAIPAEGTVELISSVKFGDLLIQNENDTDVLIDKTEQNVTVAAGQTYTITVKGNTAGNFDNNIVAFIDWNRNAILDDAGEVYELGTLTNSNGNDTVSVVFQLTVPTTATIGSTRIRLTKTYTDDESIAIINPCAIEMDAFGMGAFPGYGQALDFTVTIGGLSTKTVKQNVLSIHPNPAENTLFVNAVPDVSNAVIYDLLGKKIIDTVLNTSNGKIDISSLNTGIYILSVSSKSGNQSIRFSKK